MLVLAACQVEEASSSASEVGLATLPPIVVDTMQVQSGSLKQVLKTNAKVVARRQAGVSFLLSGRISAVLVANGATVSAGQPLATLQQEEYRLRLDRARAEEEIRKDNYRKLFLEYGGVWGDSSSLPDTLSHILKVRSGLVLAAVAVAEAQQNLTQTQLKAPFTGVLSNWYPSEGEQVQAFVELGRLYDRTQLAVEAQLPESRLPDLKEGLFAMATPIGEQRVYQLRLTEINPLVSSEGLVKIHFEVVDNQGLIPGMNLRLQVEFPRAAQLLVPQEAIVQRSDKPVVFTYKNGYAFWNYVQIGEENSEWAEILDGLKAGDTVIVSNNLQLSHQGKVTLKIK